ncbi:phosphoribosyltransferase [Kribbia dieselivorans]|uniref:phosphoribosyltransferase n=1 Tax=Kribbia dieselivorans TaxID=331526 RepID=UPI000839ABCC|nr:phosphoribosyltransferase family protein [Kribbia dieselivorans]
MTLWGRAEFVDRVDAGRRLARHLARNHPDLRGPDLVVLGLPRGGVPVAAEVARAFDAPLDVIVVRKLGAPWQPELAVGAIGEGGFEVVDEASLDRGSVTMAEVRAVADRERLELARRIDRLRHGAPPANLTGTTALIVDDGVATGATALVACQVARHLGAQRVVLAVPLAPVDFPEQPQWSDAADSIIVLARPEPFHSVGTHYDDFTATTDDEVAALLRT